MEAAIYRISGYLVVKADSFDNENVLKTIMKNRFGDYPGAKFQQLHVEKSKTFEIEKNFTNPEFQDNCDLALLERHFDVSQSCTHCDGKGYLGWKVVLDNEVIQTGTIQCKYCEGTGQFNIQKPHDSGIDDDLSQEKREIYLICPKCKKHVDIGQRNLNYLECDGYGIFRCPTCGHNFGATKEDVISNVIRKEK